MTSPGYGRPGVAARVVLAMLDFYQKGISPLTPPSCRFQPSCSHYAVEAVRVHGAPRGCALALMRLLKCAPWHPWGWDPVPVARGVPPVRDPGRRDSPGRGPGPVVPGSGVYDTIDEPRQHAHQERH